MWPWREEYFPREETKGFFAILLGTMRLAVDAHNLLEDRRGIGVYLRAVLTRILERPEVEATLVVRELFPARLHQRLAREIQCDRFRVARGVPRSAQVSWHPWNGMFFRSRAPSVATIHDCVPFAFPASDERHRANQQEPFRESARRASTILTDSFFSRDEILRYLGEARSVEVVPLAADPLYTPGAPQWLPDELRGERYLLFVGPDDARKNLSTLRKAWAIACRDEGIRLACVTSAEVPEAVCVSGLSIERLRDLYRGAWCFAMPSYYEGFGLPPLEAMRCGAPVIVSRAASLPEVCGDAALYVDEPQSVDAWVHALRTMISDPMLREAYATRGLEQGKAFSWDRCADQTYDVLARVASEGQRA